MVQEYGRYFGMPTCCLRGGCLTGPSHSGVELHGFLSYLIKQNLTGGTYQVFGYKGKQVRDNIHSYDVARFVEEFVAAPRAAEVYNLGGGRRTRARSWRRSPRVEAITGKPMEYEYVDKSARGRPHLLHQRPREDAGALSRSGTSRRASTTSSRRSSRRGRSGRDEPLRSSRSVCRI